MCSSVGYRTSIVLFKRVTTKRISVSPSIYFCNATIFIILLIILESDDMNMNEIIRRRERRSSLTVAVRIMLLRFYGLSAINV